MENFKASYSFLSARSLLSFPVVFLLSTFLLFSPTQLHAEEATETGEEEVMAQADFPFAEEDPQLWGEEEMIFSATKYMKRLREAPAIASVITAEQIRNMGARNLLDVLKTVPGIGTMVAKTNGQGLDAIESRGISTYQSQRILIMMDGHRLNNVFTGGATFHNEDLMVENIKRVEVIRGPGSALHGANAFVAVINIVTKKASDIDGIDITTGGGSFGTQHYNIMAGKEFSGIEIVGWMDYMDTNGPELFVPSDSIGRSGFTHDWKEKYDLGLKLSYGDFSLLTRYQNTDKGPYIGVLNALNNESVLEADHFLGELKYKHDFGDKLHLLVKAYYDQFHYWSYWQAYPKAFAPPYPGGLVGIPQNRTRTIGSEIQLDYYLWDNNTITAGALYEYNMQYDTAHTTNFDPNTGAPFASLTNITSTANWNTNEERSVKAFYIQDVWKFTPNLEGTFGFRFDKYSDVGSTINPRIALVWNFLPNANLKLLYATAFRAPTFEEMYNMNNAAATGNSDLTPERIKSYEAAIGYQFNSNYSLSMNYFHNDIKEIISLQPIPTGFQYENSGGATVDGIEMEFKANFEGSNYGYANYCFQYPVDSETGKRLYGAPNHRGNIGINLGLTKHLNLNSNLLVVGPRPREMGDTRSTLGGYEVLDLTLIIKEFYKTAEIRASIHNLLDEEYSDPTPMNTVARDYPRAGINFRIDVRYRF